ncbi:MAG: response regulator [Thermomicrobiales bacterium]
MMAPIIALLDNDPFFLSLMHDVLTDEGYCTLRWCAGGCDDAHALLRRAQPQLVILDLALKQRDDGWEFLKRLWGDFETTQIPTIIVSEQPEALPVTADVLRAMRYQVVRKPFLLHDLRDLRDLHDLLTAVEQMIGRSPTKCARGEGVYPVSSGDACVPDVPAAPAHAMQESQLLPDPTMMMPN